MNAITKMCKICDPSTRDHQYRVSDLAVKIGEQMHLPSHQIENIRIAGLLHDIGKICMPAEFSQKTGPLSDSDREIVIKHPQVGFDILRSYNFSNVIKECVLQHHEHVNGSGYPKGLTGDQIHLEAKIVSVADVVDAMSSHRPYNASLGIEDALNEISDKRGVYYDPTVVDACLKIFSTI